jgi:5,10-methylenetetrahydromethanopterin reductase
MRIGALIRGMTIDEIVGHVEGYRRDGYATAWLTDGVGMEALTTLAMVGRAVAGIELGTAVVRTFPRHPMALAQQALTVNASIGGRLALGVGPSHRPSVEGSWGLSFDRPVRHVREYLSVLVPLLRNGTVDFDGATLSAHGALHVEGATPTPVLVGALGPQMLRLAGAMADGSITFMTGPRTLIGFTGPTLRAAAEQAGRPPPRLVVLIRLCVTDDPAAAGRRAEQLSEAMVALPSYAAMAAREGGPVLMVGNEDAVLEQLAALEAAGVTDLVPIPLARRGSDDERRTSQLVEALLARRPGVG